MNYRMDTPLSDPSSESSGPKTVKATVGQAQKGPRVLAGLHGFFKLFLPLLIIAAVGFGAWQIVASKPEVNKRPPRETTYAVQTKRVEPTNSQPEIVLYGTVTAARKVDLRASVSGEIIWVNPELNEGRIVEVGEEMVRIDPFDYEGGVREAKANLAEARAKLTASQASLESDKNALTRLEEQLEFANNDLERAEKLAQSGSLTRQALEIRKLTLSQRQQSFEAKEFNLEVLQAQIVQQNANITRLEWKLQQAERNLENTVLKAPFTGLITTRAAELGRVVSGNDTLVSLYDPQQMDVRFTLSDAQYGRLSGGNASLIGREVKVNWKLGDTIRSHGAIIERVTPEVNAAYGGIEIYARVETSSALRAGTFVELVVPDRLYENVVSIPQAAIYNGDTVYINEGGRMAAQKIAVKAYLGDTALVDATDFEPGAEIVVTRVAEAGPGLKLTIPDGKSNSAGMKAQGSSAEGAMPRGQRPEGARKPRPDGSGRQRPEGARQGGRAGAPKSGSAQQ